MSNSFVVGHSIPVAFIIVVFRVEKTNVWIKSVNPLYFSSSEIDFISSWNVLKKTSIFRCLDKWDTLPLYMPSQNDLSWGLSFCCSDSFDDCIVKDTYSFEFLVSIVYEMTSTNWSIALNINSILLMEFVDFCLLKIRVALDLIHYWFDLASSQ